MSVADLMKQKSDLRTFWQPILGADSGRPIAYESLLRGPVGTEYEMPNTLFHDAQVEGLDHDLDYLAMQLSIERFAPPEKHALLFLNFRPDTFLVKAEEYGDIPAALAALGASPSMSRKIVFEVLESMECDENKMALIVDHMRAMGCRVAIDDMGEGFDRIHLIQRLKPDFVKTSGQLITSLGVKQHTRVVLESISTLIQSVGADMIVEGIENEDHLEVVKGMGATGLQGYVLGRPTSFFSYDPDVCKQLARLPSPRTPLCTIGQLARPALAFDASVDVDHVIDKLSGRSNDRFVLMKNGRPENTSDLQKVNENLANLKENYPSGVELGALVGSPISTPDQKVICVDERTSINEVVSILAESSIHESSHWIVTTVKGEPVGICSPNEVLWHMSQRLRHLQTIERQNSLQLFTKQELLHAVRERLSFNQEFVMSVMSSRVALSVRPEERTGLISRLGSFVIKRLPKETVVGFLDGMRYGVMMPVMAHEAYLLAIKEAVLAEFQGEILSLEFETVVSEKVAISDSRVLRLFEPEEDRLVVPIKRSTVNY